MDRRNAPERLPCRTCRDATVTVVVPCRNEQPTVGAVINDFRRALPRARIVVADNASTDATAETALSAGAEVIHVPIAGKGRAVRRLAELCVSDVVIMVDGDSTYDPSVAAYLVHLVCCDGYDLVNVARSESATAEVGGDAAYRVGHRAGNAALGSLQRTLTGIELRDILSGYKAMSRRFVTSMPIRSQGFALEVEIAAHAVALDLAYCEISAPYAARPPGSVSKLATYRDGLHILRMIVRLHRDLHPFAAFAALSVPWFGGAVALGLRPIRDYLSTGLVPRYPSLIAAGALFIVGVLVLMSGWLLERVARMRRDLLQLTANDMERSTLLTRARSLDSSEAVGETVGVARPER